VIVIVEPIDPILLVDQIHDHQMEEEDGGNHDGRKEEDNLGSHQIHDDEDHRREEVGVDLDGNHGRIHDEVRQMVVVEEEHDA